MQPQAALSKLALISGRAFSQRLSHAAKTQSAGSENRSHEIYSYIAVRDLLLADAEETPSHASLDSAAVANELVGSYLQPGRAPYQAQHLPKNEAVAEQRRCDSARGRIAQVRATLPHAA